MTANRDLDEDEVVEADEEEEEAPRRRSPLRLILLILLALVGLCILCLLGSRLLGNNLLGALPIPGLPGRATPTTAPIDTPTLAPTEPGGVPFGETAQPSPTEQPGATMEPVPTTGTEQPGATTEPPPATEEVLPPATEEPGATEEPPVTAEPTQEMIDEHGGELPTAEPTATATTQPVPGPTVTPTTGPAPGTTPQADCANNTPPTADAGDPYTTMMGKGQAFVTFDGSGSSDPDGTITTFEWDFGDGETDSGQSVTHGYSSTGTFEATLTVTDNCGATAEDKVEVTVTGPTPPAAGTGTPTTQPQPNPSATSDPNAPAGTMGFCYRVRPGNTLTGIANYFGVSLPLLAEVNGVSPAYYVIAGQGVFIPTGEVQPGPNVYEVQPGDTLDSIAFQCGLSTAKLASANGLTPVQSLTPGQFLGIPLWSWY
jgi:LysM repeat protein